ncbi:MAG: hypothetical protein WCF26_19415 [Candidatus Sulfotelmatobacter sp.]
MKKLFLAILLLVMASALVMGQAVTAGKATSSGAANAVAPTIDVLGAHNNYGRGCAGCHSPHSGNAGAGGNPVSGGTKDLWSGTNALFAQDMGPLLVGATLDFSDIGTSSTSNPTGTSKKYTLILPSTQNPATWTAQQYSDVRGIVMCLSCHDGVVAKGAMMTNHAYEQQIGALPSSYGNAPIPTLLGASGAAGGFSYNNSHPVGDNATMSAVLGSYYNATGGNGGLTYTMNSTNTSVASITPSGQYSTFAASYGYPALAGVTHGTNTSFQPVNASGVPYIVCTTCHNQHVMNVFAANSNAPIAGATTGTYATYFFVNGPYNVNNVTAALNGYAQSTTQFCRQCHFSESNEANGGPITTQF